MVVKRLSVSELLRLACCYAEQDRESWLQAMSNCTGPEDRDLVKDQEAFLEQLREYRRRRWGESRREKLWGDCKPTGVAEAIRSAMERGE